MLAAISPMIVLRVVHIVSGAIWVGALFVVVLYVQPSAAAIGPAGAPFMLELRRRRLVDVILVTALVTVVAGGFLYWHDWQTYSSFSSWICSHFGAALTAGALLATLVIGIGLLVSRPCIVRLQALGRQVVAAAGTPSPPVAAEIAALQRRLVAAERASLTLTLLAAVAMAAARYL